MIDDALIATLTQQFFNALAIGGIYALIALGYTMVYGIIELINFAHGEIFMVGAFFGMTFLMTLGFRGTIADPIVFLLVLLASFAVVMPLLGLVGVGIERFAYRPLRGAPRLAPLITAIGVSFILQNIVYIWQGPSPVQFPQILSPQVRFSVLGASVSWITVLIVVVTAVLLIALQLFVGRTRLGRAMRSTAQDRDAAQLMGVNINTTIALTFFLGSALAGAAGIVYGLYFGTIAFNIGFIGGLKAFTAAVLGGIGNTTGAVLGGFLIGFVEVISAQLGLAIWSHALVFAVLVIVLVFRPAGLLGQPIGERA
jgi:branched-chain amino acid transport system permease protein